MPDLTKYFRKAALQEKDDFKKAALQEKDLREKRAKTIHRRRNVLIELEQLIGKSFCNDISNGTFRYPLTFFQPEKPPIVVRRMADDISDELMMRGCYRLGNNEVEIFGALNRALEHLEQHYRLVRGEWIRRKRRPALRP